MSWREVLGVAVSEEIPPAQNTFNPQNTLKAVNSMDFVNCVEGESKLLDAIAEACQHISITPLEVRNALSVEDIRDWQEGKIGHDLLAAFAQALVERREMDKGRVPATYTKKAECKQCGPVWLWFSGTVLGCPWCWNRSAGRPIPRPGTE